MRYTVVFDFDGVIHSYKSGWKGVTEIPDPPVSGIKEAINKIREKFNVVVVSTRCISPEGIKAVKNWLNKYNIVVDDIAAEKPPAICYVDDRAICFNGNAAMLPDLVKNFKAWWE